MSVRVDLEALADVLADYGFGYLLTVSDDLRPHAVAVQPDLGGGRFTLGGLGGRTHANLSRRSDVTLVFPPREAGGYSLIVDGRATAVGSGAELVPTHAVLHRPAPGAAQPADGSCGNDCLPVTTTAQDA